MTLLSDVDISMYYVCLFINSDRSYINDRDRQINRQVG